MYLDTFGNAARVQNNVHLTAPLRLAWTFESQELMPSPLAEVQTAVVYGSKELVTLGADGSVDWRIAGDFSGGARHRPGLLIAVRTLNGAKRWTVLDRTNGNERRCDPADHSLDALTGDIVIGRKLSGEDPWFEVSLEASSVDVDGRRTVLWSRVSTGAHDENFSKLFAASKESVFLARGRSVVALDIKTGAERWTSDVADLGGTPSLEAYPRATEGVCVVVTKTWTTGFQVDSGRRMWSTPIWGAHVVYDDAVYIIQHDTLYVLDLGTGALRLRREIGAEMTKKGGKPFQRIATALAASETHLWCGDPFGTLWALNRATGRPEWHHRPKGTTGYMGAVPAISATRLYIPSFSMDTRFPAHLYCYEQAS